MKAVDDFTLDVRQSLKQGVEFYVELGFISIGMNTEAMFYCNLFKSSSVQDKLI